LEGKVEIPAPLNKIESLEEFFIHNPAEYSKGYFESLNKEKMNNNCRILVSGDSLKFLKKENYNIEDWGECKVKGRESLVKVYEIL